MPAEPVPLSLQRARPVPVQSIHDSSLPRPLTALVGRDLELSQIQALIDAGETRLVTLTGPGGIGKTRLAIAVAAAMEPDFAHGACFVGLASVRDPELIPVAVARALGLQESGDQSAAELVMSAMRDRHLLLVLDNLEHVIDAAAIWTRELLDHCPRLTVLATSRTILQIGGEQRYPVPPLGLPKDVTNEPVASSAAVDLFVQRARAVRPDFALTARTAETVRKICLALDGMPLAIELAAARLHVLSPEALLARLTDRLAILQGNVRDAQPRHRTMRDTIAWSYDLLSPEQQALFRRLSVFTGGFSLDAAEAIGGERALDLLTSLVDHSLVQQEVLETGESRYRLLEVLREYGLERLNAMGEIEIARDAHASWAHALARGFERGVEEPAQVAWLHRLADDYSNVRSALAWLVDNDRIEDAQDLAGSLWLYYSIHGYFDESRRLYASLIAHPHGRDATVGRAKALLGLGVMLTHQGAAEPALPALDEAAEIFDRLGDRRRLVIARIGQGVALDFLGRIDDSVALTREALALAREIDAPFYIASAICNLCLDALRRGDLDEARRQAQESINIARDSGNIWGLAINTGNLAIFELMAGHDEVAEPLSLETAELMRAIDSKRDLPIILADLADIARRRGDLDGAYAHLSEALAIADDTGNSSARVGVLSALARVEQSAGRLVQATAAARSAFEVWQGYGNVPAYADCLDLLADIAIGAGDMTAAARMIGGADAIRDRDHLVPLAQFPGEHERRLGAIVNALGEPEFRKAWEAGHSLGADDMVAEALAWEPPLEMPIEAQQTGVGPAAALSRREFEVLRLMAEGLTNQQIADQLFVSRRTATSHASNILAKLDLPSRTAAVAWALRNGIA